MNNLIKRLYIPEWLDWISILIGIIPVLKASNNVIFQTGFWSIFIFLSSIVMTSFSKNMNEKYNKNVKRKRRHMRRHKNISYPKYQVTEIQYDLNVNFKAFRFMISAIAIVILTTVGTFGSHSYQFKYFLFSFFINLFLIPLLLMLIYACSYDCIYSEEVKSKLILKGYEKAKFTCRNMLNALYIDKNEKKRVVKGTVGLLALIFFAIIAISFHLGFYK